MPKFSIRLTRSVDTYLTVEAPDADKAKQLALSSSGVGDEDHGDNEAVYCHKTDPDAEVDLVWEEADEQ